MSQHPLHIYSGADVSIDPFHTNFSIGNSAPSLSPANTNLNQAARKLDNKLLTGSLSLLHSVGKSIFKKAKPLYSSLKNIVSKTKDALPAKPNFIKGKALEEVASHSRLFKATRALGPAAFVLSTTIDAYKGATEMAEHGPGPVATRFLKSTNIVENKTKSHFLESIGSLPFENLANTLDTINTSWKRGVSTIKSTPHWSAKAMHALELGLELSGTPIQGVAKTLERRVVLPLVDYETSFPALNRLPSFNRNSEVVKRNIIEKQKEL